MTENNVVSIRQALHSTTDSSTSEQEGMFNSLANQMSEISIQNDTILEIINEHLKVKSSFSESSYRRTTWHINPSIELISSNIYNAVPYTTHKIKVVEQSSVKLHTLLKVGSILVAFVCLGGISTWLVTDVPLINPFASLLGLLATPFFYVMGILAKKNV